MLREATLAGIGQLAAMQTASPSFGVDLHPIDVSDAGEIERMFADFREHRVLEQSKGAIHFVASNGAASSSVASLT